MRGQTNKLYLTGCLLVFVGGCGLADISMDSHFFFWLYAILFSAGIGCCLLGYER